MIIKTLRAGFRMAEVPSHEHPRAHGDFAHPRVAQRAALRLLARQVPLLLTRAAPSRAIVNVLGIWDGHDAGAALLQDGRLRRRRQRRAVDAPQARGPVSARSRSRRAWRTPACAADEVDVVAVSTSDPAKTLGRVVARQQGAVLRRCGAARRCPGALAGLTRAVKYRMTEWPPGRCRGG